MSDQKLVERTRFGDDMAFKELIQQYYQEIQLFILQTGVPVEVLGDAVKKTFMQANRTITSFEGVSVSAWLYRLARDTAVSYKSRPLPEGEGIEKENIHRAVEPLRTLPEKYRVPFLLYHLHGQSYQEIIEILSTDENTAKHAVEEAWNQLEKDTDGAEKQIKEVEKRYKEFSDFVTVDDIWDYLNKMKKKSKTRVGWFIGIGGTLSALSLGIFLLLSQSVLLPEESEVEEEPASGETQDEEVESQ